MSGIKQIMVASTKVELLSLTEAIIQPETTSSGIYAYFIRKSWHEIGMDGSRITPPLSLLPRSSPVLS